jgi:hypothetical protein
MNPRGRCGRRRRRDWAAIPTCVVDGLVSNAEDVMVSYECLCGSEIFPLASDRLKAVCSWCRAEMVAAALCQSGDVRDDG